MAYTELINQIKAAIKNNGVQLITGDLLQAQLLDIIDTLDLDITAIEQALAVIQGEGGLAGLQQQIDLKEPIITAGTAQQYIKGDKTLGTLNTDAVVEGNNLYHTTARVQEIGDSRYIKADQRGVAGGVATLNETGVIPASQLPGYLDDVLEFPTLADFPAIGESGKIFLAKDTNKTYRWSGSTYAPLNEGVVLGETSETAYRGDRGKIAYDHSQITAGTGVHISNAERINWNAAFTDKHTHSNKSVLDGITSELITGWNLAHNNSHTHDNKSVLDGITSGKVTAWDGAVTDRHTHANKLTIDGISEAKVIAWDSAATNNHTHANKAALDSITAAKITNWDTAHGWGNHASAGYALASSLDNYLLKTGGTLEGASESLLTLNNTTPSASASYINYKASGVSKALIGYIGAHGAAIQNVQTGALLGIVGATGQPYYAANGTADKNGLYHAGNANNSSTDWTARELISEKLRIPSAPPTGMIAGKWYMTMADTGWSAELPGGGTGGVTSLWLLDETSLVGSPSNNQALVYNQTTSKWSNATLMIAHIDGLQAALNGKEAAITAGTAAQYIRGDKTLGTMPTSLPASDVYSWAKAASKPSYSFSEITDKPATYAPSAHTHTKADITDFAHTHDYAATNHNHDGTYALLAGSTSQAFSVSSLTASNVIVSGGNKGFQNDGYYVNVANPIWAFGNAPAYGISYYQGSALSGVGDAIGFHFGIIGTPPFYVTMNGDVKCRDIAMNGALSGATTGSFSGNVSAASFTSGGNAVLHAGNYSSYALPLSGGDITGENLALNASRQGGWAYGYQIKHSGNQVFYVNLYGDTDTALYAYLGLNITAYNSANALRIYPTYASWGHYPLWHSGNLTNTLSNGYLPYWNGSSLVNSNIINATNGIHIPSGVYRGIWSYSYPSGMTLSAEGTNINIEAGWNERITLNTGASGYENGLVYIPYGKLGIGYTDRSEKLAVNGDIFSSASITATSKFKVDGEGAGLEFYRRGSVGATYEFLNDYDNKLKVYSSTYGFILQMSPGGNAEISGIISLPNTTQSTAYTNGAMVLSGGLGIAKDLYSNGKAVFASSVQMLENINTRLRIPKLTGAPTGLTSGEWYQFMV